MTVRRGRGDEGGGVPEGDLGQASLASCRLKRDTQAPLLPSTWIAYLMLIWVMLHTLIQMPPGSLLSAVSPCSFFSFDKVLRLQHDELTLIS